MRIRPALQQDIPFLALIGAQAFGNDHIYAHFYPFRDAYPRDFYEGILMTLRKSFVTPGHQILAIELEPNDLSSCISPQELLRSRLVGYMTFVCHGSADQKAAWNTDTTEKRLQRELLAMEEREIPNRAVSKENIANFYNEERQILGDLGNSVECPTLAVLPEFQYMGFGCRTFEYAQKIIWEKGMELVFDASQAGLPLYLKRGATVEGYVHLKSKLERIGNLEATLPEVSVPVMRSRPQRSKI
ncbi:hypothetical protein BDV59DRAFT_212189 [Aspergillus ambiguus]|uniref:uncharacterized protein n=1 Tax=Aspergillus ambiguus TaxID=176160 RepID=UPI003CCDC10F